MPSDAHLPSSDALWPILTGHESPAILVETALTVVGPALGTFVANAMETQVRATNPRAHRAWVKHRLDYTQKFGRNVNPYDARNLLLELRRFWSSLRPCMPSARDSFTGVADQVHTIINRKSFMTIVNGVKHNEAVGETGAAQVLLALHGIMRLIQANAEIEYLRPLVVAAQTRSRVKQAGRSSPETAAVRRGTTCAGAHWVQPKMGIPGQWWWIAIRDDRIQDLDVDLTTDDVVQRIGALSGPSLVGLAFCFSAPASYVLRDDVGSIEAMWKCCEPFSHRSAETAVGSLGDPFRIVKPRQPMRRPGKHPNAFRDTEIDVWQRTAAEPSSIFDIQGTDSVGALALNGMPALREARASGAAIWPFDEPRDDGVTCVEIFPRSLWARINPTEAPKSKRHHGRRELFVAQTQEIGLSLQADEVQTVTDDERAFDTFLTAWALSQYGGALGDFELLALAPFEGQIWIPE